jgi:hypothetical protein
MLRQENPRLAPDVMTFNSSKASQYYPNQNHSVSCIHASNKSIVAPLKMFCHMASLMGRM